MSIKLETERLILRHPVQDDASAIIRYLNNYEITKNTARIPYPYGAADADRFFAWAEGAGRFVFALAEKAVPEALIGIISLEREDDPAHGEIGYWLAESFWGRGLMSEAAREVVRFGFAVAGLNAISATYHLGNEASKRILEGLGFANVRRETGFSLAQSRDVPIQRLRLNLDSYVNAKKRGQ